MWGLEDWSSSTQLPGGGLLPHAPHHPRSLAGLAWTGDSGTTTNKLHCLSLSLTSWLVHAHCGAYPFTTGASEPSPALERGFFLPHSLACPIRPLSQ